MNRAKEINFEIESLNGLKSLVNAYEEIASIRMKQTRDVVLKSRVYVNQINEIFNDVRNSYARELKQIYAKKGSKGKNITLLSHNGKTVAVLLSANTGLYGDIVLDTYNRFINDVARSDVEITIIGRYGLSLYLAEGIKKPYTFFELPDFKMKAKELDEIIKHVVQYESIELYYGQFINLVEQQPKILEITAQLPEPGVGEVSNENKFLFEPSIEKILMFFEAQIFASLFGQAVREGQLAKYASRVKAMTRAEDNISRSLNILNTQKLRSLHKGRNQKMNERISGVLGST